MPQEKAKTCEEYVLNQFYDLQELFTEVAKKKNELAMKWELVKRIVKHISIDNDMIYFKANFIGNTYKEDDVMKLIELVIGEENGKH